MAATTTTKALNIWLLIFLGMLVGVIGGFGAVIFRLMIGFFHNLLFFGRFDFIYNSNVHAQPSVWGMGIILVPAVGALVVTWLVRNFAPEAKGHGVPEVIDAIYYKRGVIRPLVALIKSLASAISIGSGGSVGREGPIIQIGSAFGSTLGQIINMPLRQRVILIAAGAGAGIAATFNAPIGGVAFAIELLLVSINAATISVVAIATITASYIGRGFLGLYPAFDIPMLTTHQEHITNFYEFLLFIPFGILIGFAAWLFIHMIYWFEDGIDALPGSEYLRYCLGMLVMGLLMYVFMATSGNYYVQGVGYATIGDILSQSLTNPWFLLLLAAAKLFATSLTLGSGASGGVFSPGLFVGACLGGAVGNLMATLFPGIVFSPDVFAVAGMAGMISGTTGAVLTAITMLFEMTRDYSAILPIVLTVALAYVTRTLISPESIYTLKLIRRGHVVPEGLQAAITTAKQVKHVMNPEFISISEQQLTSRSPELGEAKLQDVPILVHHEQKILGVLRGNEIDSQVLYVAPTKNLVQALRAMKHQQCQVMVVLRYTRTKTVENIVGVITAREIAGFVSDSAELIQEHGV